MEIEFDGYQIIGVDHPRAPQTAVATPLRATRLNDGAPVVIKIFALGEGERAEREADIGHAIDHPHILRAIDVVRGDTTVGLVFPWMAGGSLADLIVVRRRLRWPETLTVLIGLADALAAAHERGLVHGDVSAGNVLFDGVGRPMLADFGASRAATETGTEVWVTPQDVAPEIVRGAAPGPASDLFSLGSVALTCLTGRAAWPADDLQDVLIQSAAGQWPNLDDHMAPTALRTVVRRLLDPEPVERGSAAQLAVELRRVGDPEPVLLVAGSAGSTAQARAATVVRPDALRPPASETQLHRRKHGARTPRSRAQNARWRKEWAKHAEVMAGRMSWRGAVASLVLIALITGAVGLGTWWGAGPAASAPLADSAPAAVGLSRSSWTFATMSAGGPSSTSAADAAALADIASGTPPMEASNVRRPESETDWARVVNELDTARSEAFVARDAALLSSVYTPESPTRGGDVQRIAALHRADLRPADARHRVRSVRVVTSSPNGSATLAVTEDQPTSALYDASGALVGHSPAVVESTVLMHLQPVGGSYRISRVEAG